MLRRTFRQWPVVAAIAIVAGASAYIASTTRTSQYQATTIVQLNPVDLNAVFLQQNLQQLGDDTRSKAATNAKLVTLPRVREVAARALGGRVSPARLADAISVSTSEGTTLVEITATDRDPRFAARMADATRDAFIEVRRQTAVSQFNTAATELTDQIKAGTATPQATERLQQIELLKSVTNGGVDTVQTARIPTAPVSPRPLRDGVLGLFLGGLLGLGIAVLRSQLDTRVRDEGELTEMWDLPLLGLIPETDELKDGHAAFSSGPAVEAFSLARTNLRYLQVGSEVKTVIVTSATAGEGKSTVAWNLAIATSLADARVLVIEADLRRPVLSARLGLGSQYGLSEVLAGIATFDEAVLHAQYGDGSVQNGGTTIDVVLAGMTPPSPVALLERRGLDDVLNEAASRYDLVIVDTPPATVVADAKVVSQRVDGIIVVSRLGVVERAAFERLRDLLADLAAPVLGIVVNGGSSLPEYSYGSYYLAPDGEKPVHSTPTLAPGDPATQVAAE